MNGSEFVIIERNILGYGDTLTLTGYIRLSVLPVSTKQTIHVIIIGVIMKTKKENQDVRELDELRGTIPSVYFQPWNN